MKKILVLATAFFATLTTTFSQKISVDSFKVHKNFTVDVYLSNGEVKNMNTIINPKMVNGRAVSGRLTGQGLLLTPPIKPAGWEKDYYGSIVPVGPQVYNMGFSPFRGTAYIVEGVWNSDGKTIEFSGREQECGWGPQSMPNAVDWFRNYENGSYTISGYKPLPMNVVKTVDKNFVIY